MKSMREYALSTGLLFSSSSVTIDGSDALHDRFFWLGIFKHMLWQSIGYTYRIVIAVVRLVDH